MELWWNLDILWWNLDRFEHKFDGNITNWPCWSEGKLGTGPFTWLGQGFQTNFSEIPFQKRENLSIYGQNYGQLRSITDFWRSFNRSKIGLIFTPDFCNASRNKWLRNMCTTLPKKVFHSLYNLRLDPHNAHCLHLRFAIKRINRFKIWFVEYFCLKSQTWHCPS